VGRLPRSKRGRRFRPDAKGWILTAAALAPERAPPACTAEVRRERHEAGEPIGPRSRRFPQASSTNERDAQHPRTELSIPPTGSQLTAPTRFEYIHRLFPARAMRVGAPTPPTSSRNTSRIR
jgi:hypothetical protein